MIFSLVRFLDNITKRGLDSIAFRNLYSILFGLVKYFAARYFYTSANFTEILERKMMLYI